MDAGAEEAFVEFGFDEVAGGAGVVERHQWPSTVFLTFRTSGDGFALPGQVVVGVV